MSVPYRDEIYRSAAFAAVGRLDEVHVWDSIGAEEGGTYCYSDSRMPCFFDAGVLADLDGMFRDPDFVTDLADQVSEETVAPVEFGGQVAAVAFADNGGSGVYEVLGGFDAGGALVAALIDVGVLEQHARERLS